MTLNKVTLTLDLYDGTQTPITSGMAYLQPSSVLVDSSDVVVCTKHPIPVSFAPTGLPTVTLLATDNAGLNPAGWAWILSVVNEDGYPLPQQSFLLPFAAGANQQLSSVITVQNPVAFQPYLPLSGGDMTGWLAPAVVPLAYGTTIAINAALGNVFAVTLGGSTGTITNPTNPQDGQVIRVRIAQDATGGRTVAWGSAFDWGSAGAAPVLTTLAGKVDTLAFEYNAALTKWCYMGASIPQGF